MNSNHMSLDLLPRDQLLYLTSPYSKYPLGIWSAYKEVARIAGLLVVQGVNVFSPIAHAHPLAIYAKIDPLDCAFWMRADAPFCRMAEGLIVAQMNGWAESKGVTSEIDIFQTARKPIWMLNPETLEIVSL